MAPLDTDLLLRTGAIEGPYRRCRPVRRSLRRRLMRTLRTLVGFLLSASLWLYRLAEFVAVYRLYRQHNTVSYSARIAYGCAFRRLHF